LSARESFSWLANLNMKRRGGSCDNKTIGNATRGWDFPLLWFEVGGKINATDCPGDFFNKKNKKTMPHTRCCISADSVDNNNDVL